MLTTLEAIEQRRSVRKYKLDPIPEEQIQELIEAARLAPSGCNAQPWRFKIVTDRKTKIKLAFAAHKQTFIARAPAIIVCCADIKAYLDGSVSSIQDLGKIGAVRDNIVEAITDKANEMKTMPVEQVASGIIFNVAIAIEHIVLRALDFGLGTCWIRLMDTKMVKSIFNWDDNTYVVALLPIGYPAESPKPRSRKSIKDLML